MCAPAAGQPEGSQQRRHLTALHAKKQDASSTRTLCRMSGLSFLCIFCSCELLPVALDDLGLVPSHLDALLTARQAAGQPMPKLLYTIPTGEANTAQHTQHSTTPRPQHTQHGLHAGHCRTTGCRFSLEGAGRKGGKRATSWQCQPCSQCNLAG